MKTLERFWQWYDAEKPNETLAVQRAGENLSELAAEALTDAAADICARIGVGQDEDWPDETWWLNALEEHPGALRDYSLVLCRGLEAMHVAVPEAVKDPRPLCVECHRPWTPAEGEDATKDACRSCVSWPRPFAREYIGEWLPAAMPTDTFRGVDRTEDKLLSGVRVPQSFNLERHLDEYCPCLACAGKRNRQTETQRALAQRDEYSMRAANYLASVVPLGTVSPPEREAQQHRLSDRNLGYNELVIHLAPSMSLKDCDSFRGLRPNHIVVKGDAAACPQWEYLRDQVLVPMTLDGATIEKR